MTVIFKNSVLRSGSPLKPLTTLSIGNQAAKVETTMLASMSDFMIISFQEKLNIKWNMINALCSPYYKVIMSNEVKQMQRAFLVRIK